MSERSEYRLWESVTFRLVLIALIGWAMVLWFQGCLVPLAKDDVRREQEKAVGAETPQKQRPR